MKTLISKLGILLCTGLFILPVAGQEQTPTTPVPAEPEAAAEAEPIIEPEAMEILGRMAERLAEAERLSVEMRIGYDVVQESGQKIEFGERRTVMLSRPDRLRFEAQLSNGDERRVVFDGQTITVFDPSENVYAQLERPGSADEAIRYVVGNLQVRVPLALLFVTTLPADLERRVQSLALVEEDTLTDVPTVHLAGQTKEVDFQIWVARAGEPLPRRLVITYKHAEGEPQFWALFSDWNLASDVPEPQFAFSPPEGAEQIPFLVRVRRQDAVSERDEERDEGGEQ